MLAGLKLVSPLQGVMKIRFAVTVVALGTTYRQIPIYCIIWGKGKGTVYLGKQKMGVQLKLIYT